MSEQLDLLGARAEIYKFLSVAYSSPEQVLLAKDLWGTARRAFDIIEKFLFATELKEIDTYVQRCQDSLSFSIEYTRLFRGPVKADVYPYESMYMEGEIVGKSTIDVVDRYLEAGVRVSDEFKDLPDHICVEMGFMSYICAQELIARQQGMWDEAVRFQHIGDNFITNHLSRWISRFSDLVMQHSNLPYYVNLARMTGDFISREITAIRAQPVS